MPTQIDFQVYKNSLNSVAERMGHRILGIPSTLALADCWAIGWGHTRHILFS